MSWCFRCEYVCTPVSQRPRYRTFYRCSGLPGVRNRVHLKHHQPDSQRIALPSVNILTHLGVMAYYWMICGPWGHYIQVNLNKNRKTFYCFFAIHGIASVKRSCLPFGNTFGLFCFPRVHPALLGNIYPTFRLRGCCWAHLWETLLPLFASERPLGIRKDNCAAHLALIVPGECPVTLLSNARPHFCRPRTGGGEACYYSLIWPAT